MSNGTPIWRVGAAALSLGLTSGLMVSLRLPHRSAGTTTLIVSPRILIPQLGVLMLAVVLLTIQAFTINGAAGIDHPGWAPKQT